jgi:hypothetical protein
LYDLSEEFLEKYPFGRKGRKHQDNITTVTKKTGAERRRWVGSYPVAGFGVRGVEPLCSANRIRQLVRRMFGKYVVRLGGD